MAGNFLALFSSISFSFYTLRTLLHNGRTATPWESMGSALFLSQRGCTPSCSPPKCGTVHLPLEMVAYICQLLLTSLPGCKHELHDAETKATDVPGVRS